MDRIDKNEVGIMDIENAMDTIVSLIGLKSTAKLNAQNCGDTDYVERLELEIDTLYDESLRILEKKVFYKATHEYADELYRMWHE